MMGAVSDSNLAELAAYVPRVLGGDAAAWQELVAQLESHLIPLLRTSRVLGPLRHNIDDCRAVMLSVFERLSKDNHRGLRLFQPWADANPGKNFGDWIRIVTANMARDHVSSRLGGAGRFADADDVPLNKRMLNTLATLLPTDDDNRLAFRPAMTNIQLARELLEYAERSLEGTQLRALRGWMEGATFDEIAAQLGLAAPRDADKLVRAALARLRRHFSDDD